MIRSDLQPTAQAASTERSAPRPPVLALRRTRPGAARLERLPRRVLALAGSRGLLASIGIHGGLLLTLALLPAPAGPPGRPGARGHRIEIARAEARLELDSGPEPLPLLESADELVEESLAQAELVPREIPAAEPDPPEPAAPLDASFAYVDPLRAVALDAWAAPRRRERTTEPVTAPARAAPAPAAPPPAAPSRASEAVGGDEPEVVQGPIPSYPRAARRLGFEGSVELRALVRRDGTVSEVTIVSSSGHAVLDEAGRSKLYEWRFRPWRPGDSEVRSYLKTFTFELPR